MSDHVNAPPELMDYPVPHVSARLHPDTRINFFMVGDRWRVEAYFVAESVDNIEAAREALAIITPAFADRDGPDAGGER